ncbi:hypothetical protein M2T82_00585 [Elizabethkingia ursingii]|uniref:hypothetical protein n=1 Tax=Elizabethkingia ursingii TaxID=1756150 RepID=UPI002012320A|nr:hypothetical protein [Elizabethkingia ursingii]MCL1666549.1 hypothetical protein [Elizabethkingia ursingii]
MGGHVFPQEKTSAHWHKEYPILYVSGRAIAVKDQQISLSLQKAPLRVAISESDKV